MHLSTLPPENIPGNHFCQWLSQPQGRLLQLISVGPAETRIKHRNPQRFIVLNPILVPRSTPEALHVEWRERPLLAKGGIMGEKWPVKYSLTMQLPRHCRVL
jgi:hypothetical protein